MTSREKRHPQIPDFESKLLDALGLAFGRRAKALKHKTFGFKCDRTGDDADGESLRVHGRKAHDARIEIAVWDEGEIWVSVHVPARGANNGWQLAFTGYGSVRELAPHRVVEMYESMLANYQSAGEILDVWCPANVVETG